MALHTSTIVLGLLTAVPFGLAIRDQVTGKGAYAPDGDEYESDMDEAYERRMEAERAYEEEQERKRAEDKERFEKWADAIGGAEAGSLALAGIRLGMNEVALTPEANELLRDLESETRANVTLDWKLGSLSSVVIGARKRYSDDASFCDVLKERLADRWTASANTYDDDGLRLYWAHSAQQTRATLYDDDMKCALTFERAVSIEQWLDKKGDTIVPLAALNGAAAPLVAKLGPNAFSNKQEIRWTATGLGLGTGETELYARIERGKIVTITATVKGPREARNAITERLDELYGERDYDTGTWNKNISIDETDAGYVLTAGKPLPDETE